MNPRFPPQGSPEWREFVEQWFVRLRVDNNRQWSHLRSVAANSTGLNAVQPIASLSISGTGRGSGSGCLPCGTITLVVSGSSCGAANGTFSLAKDPGGCTWSSGVWVLSQTDDNFPLPEPSARLVGTFGTGIMVFTNNFHPCFSDAGAFATASNSTGCTIPTFIGSSVP